MKELTGISMSGETRLQSTAKKSSGKALIFLRSLCLFVCMAGALQMAMEAFRLELHIEYVLIGLAVDCLILGIGEAGKGFSKICLYIWNCLVFLAGAFRWRQVVSGYIAVENGIRRQMGEYYGINLALRKIPMEEEKGEVFVFLVFTLLILVLGKLVVQKGRIAMLALMMVLLFALELLCGSRFQEIGAYLTAGSILVLYVMGYRKDGRNQRILYRTGMWTAGILLVLAAVCCLILGPLLYQYTKVWNKKLYDTIQQATDKISSAVRSQNGLFGNHTPTADGSLNNYPLDRDQKTDLRVTLTEMPNHSIYLRGFIGDTYEGTYWHRIDEREFLDAFPQDDAAYQIQNILYRYIGTHAGEGESSVKVERLDPGGEYGYVPYGFETPNDANLRGDSYYSSAEKEIIYDGYPNWKTWLGEGAAGQAESEIEAQYKEYAADQYLKIPVNGLDRLKEYCAQQNFTSVQEVIDFVVPKVQEGRVYSMDLEPVPEDKDFAEYFFFDQKKGYCIHYATTATLMFRLMGVPARYATGYMVAPDAFVQNGDSYIAEVPDTQAHAWVEIYRSGKGWIPLEVTPGYGTGIDGDDIDGLKEEELSQSAPVPTEAEPTPDEADFVTPAPEEQEAQEPTPEIQGAEDGVEVQPEGTGEEGGLETQGENGEEKSGLSMILSVVLKIFLTAAAIVLLAAAFMGAVWVNRRRILKNRSRVFFQRDRNQGICEISYGLYQMLWDAGIRSEDVRDEVYARKMEEKLGWVETEEFVRFICIAQKAAYSREQMTEEQRQKCYEFYQKVAFGLWEGMDRRKKIWWKYMKCYEIS